MQTTDTPSKMVKTEDKDKFGDTINPAFNFENIIEPEEIKQEAEQLSKSFDPNTHEEILRNLIKQVDQIDFREKAGLEEDERIQRKHYIVCIVDEILRVAKTNNWQLCRNNEQTFLYNGNYWKAIDREILHSIFGEAAEIMGLSKVDSRHYQTRRELILQFEAVAYLPAPQRTGDTTLVNLRNGTFEVSGNKQVLRSPSPDDFITYQLPFDFDSEADCPVFLNFLNRVIPDAEKQAVLQEYIGSVFINTQCLKLEKILLLFGGGANGKSVIIDVINALLGKENVSSYSLQSLTDSHAYTRAELANKLVNCASEISGRMENSLFKQLASGEPVEARHIYGRPFTMENYAKLIFSTNELPKEVEQTHGYYRRWIIIPFDVTIPEHEQDKELSKKIIANELSGVFNWVLDGLKRLLKNKGFSKCDAIAQQLEEFKRQSDSVQMFIDDSSYKPSLENHEPMKEVYKEYRLYCGENGFHPCATNKFGTRLRNMGFTTDRKKYGNLIYLEK